jgi:hypothetical protein
METGKYIDKAAVHEQDPGALFCKDGHQYAVP